MKDPIRILLIDDNPDDRALVIRELHRTFSEVITEEITNQKQFNSVLNQSCPDLVITDFQLRWTDGLVVLRTLKTQWPDLPIIMFTGTGSEEIAVEAMKAGLDDYVLKSPKHYARLSSAAKVTFKLALQKQRIDEAENRYTTLFNSIPIGLYAATPHGKIIHANPALVQMLGYPSLPSLQSTSLPELFIDRTQYELWRSIVGRQGVVFNFHAQMRCCDGRLCWVNYSARALKSDSGNLLCYEGSIEDITERKKAEDEREKLILELQDALAKIKTLSGFLPICASCKKIRDDKGYWNQIEVYIETHSDAEFTHSFCPDCVKRLYPEVLEELT
jgi:PAS domain S-box-containing protein